MNIDLFKLNNFNKLEIDENVIIPKEYLEKTDIRDIKSLNISGEFYIDEVDNICSSIYIKGTFVLPCAYTLEDVFYDFDVEVDEILGKFEDFYNKNKKSIDILPFIWENIVPEVPIRVVKEGAKPTKLNGDGWELVSSES